MEQSLPAPTRRLRPAVAALSLRQAAQSSAERLSADGNDVELHGLVGNDRGAPVMAAYAAVLVACCLAALSWPLRAGLALLLVGFAGLQDLEGGRSWVRRLAPRDSGRALVLWRRRSRRIDDPRPVVLVTVPAEATRARSPGLFAGVLAAVAVIGGLGAVLRPFAHDLAGMLLVTLAALAGITGLLALLVDLRGRRLADLDSGARLAERIADAAGTLGGVDLAVAVVGVGALFHDGVEVLLRNHRHRLPPDRTTVVAWQPGPGPLSAIRREGWLVRSTAAARLHGVVDRLGLPDARGVTGAARARRCGWAAIGLHGGLDEPASVVRGLAEVARRVAHELGEGEE